MQYISFLAIFLIMCAEARAQRPEPSGPVPPGVIPDTITPLRIGDTIPEYLWHLPLPHWNGLHTQAMFTLNDFRDRKLILLDFWASYCTTCLNGFPLLDSLQRIYPEHLQVVLINPAPNKDTPGRIVQAFSRRLRIPLSLPVVFPDIEVYRHFEISGIPRYIWIDSKRIVRAITKKAEVTAETIQTFITSQQP